MTESTPRAGRLRQAIIRAGVLLAGDRAILKDRGSSLIARLLHVPPSRYRPHPYTLYELNPEWRSNDGRSRHNGLGFRGPEIAPRKRPGAFRIVCMGESTTYCTGIDNDAATYPARLEAHLRRLRGDLDVEVVNAGVGGYTSIENLLRYHFHVAPLAPDLVVYYYTHNDVHPRRLSRLARDYRDYSRSWFEPPFGGGIKGFVARRLALASGDIGNLVRRYDEHSGLRHSSNVERNPPDVFRANMRALALLTKADGARVLFVNPPYRDLAENDRGSGTNPAHRAVWEHRRVLSEIAAELDLAVYDLARDMPYPTDPGAFPNENYLDFVHVSPQGADLMGRLVAEAVLAAELCNSNPARTELR